MVEEMENSGWMTSNVLERKNQLTNALTGLGAKTTVCHTIKQE